jgi:gamma-glutamyltranspeptidase / glutathione hydrolase
LRHGVKFVPILAAGLVLTLAACEAPAAAPAGTTSPAASTSPAATAPPTTPRAEPTPAVSTASPEAERPPHVEAVVSSNERATNAGRQILETGGTAADASVAVAAVLSVVEPYYSSVLGGGTWGLYFDADRQAVTSVNGVGPVGSKATLADYRSRADTFGMHQAIVPGAWDGWMAWLEEYGELELGEILAPAIAAAREGYPVSSEMSYWLNLQAADIRNSPALSSLYLRNGRLVATGEIVQQQEMAATFEALVAAYDGAKPAGHAAGLQAARDYYYRGPIAEAIVAFSDQNGGYFTAQDFSGFEAEIVEPISVDYNDQITVYQNPPNSQGIAMLQALNILKGYDFSGQSAHDPDVVHRQVEAVKLAYADRYEHVGDPDRAEVPVAELLSESYAATQRERIDMGRAASWPIASGLDRQATDTTTFSITDSAGNAAAVTTSLGGQFLVVGDTGIHINERMSFMSLEEGNVNVVAPGATVRQTSNPYMALRNGKPFILGGNTGIDT